jgi:xylulokinase
MAKDILIGIDIGSSNVKTVVFNQAFDVLASETQEYTTILPQPGWSEYRPDQWWECVRATLARALKKGDVNPARIAGIGLSGLGCCPVPMDETGKVIYNGIPWSDQRAQNEVQFLMDNCREMIFEKCKNTPTTLNATTHLMWIKNQRPDIYRRIHKYTEPSGFLGQRFTGEYTMDYGLASSLDFGFDTKTLDWDDELINAMGLDKRLFPRLHPNTEPLGVVSAKAAAETGVPEGVPVFAGGVDLLAAALAAGAVHPGQGFYSMGSGANMMAITDNQEIASPYLISFIHPVGPQLRVLDGVQGSIGYSMRWFRDQLGDAQQEAARLSPGIDAFELLTLEGFKSKPGAGGVIYLPHLFGKFHPVLNPAAKGVFFGISPGTTKAQLIRAVMEGCAYAAYQSLKNILDLGVTVDEIIVTGGPSKSALWCQIMADVFGRKLVTVNAPEASPFGNAVLAGVGTGMFSSFEEVAQRADQIDKVYEPNTDLSQMYMDMFGLYEQTYQSLLSSFDELAKIQSKHGL